MPTVSKTLEIRKCIKQIIEECGCKAYYEVANKAVTFPYAVFEFNMMDISDNVKRELEVTIDIWDKSEESSRIERITDNIVEALNHKLKFLNGRSLRIYGMRRRSLTDEDETLKRRQVECLVIYFDRRD